IEHRCCGAERTVCAENMSIGVIRVLGGAPFLVGVLLNASVVWATEYHVATTGSNDNAGTSDQPFKTIQKAADVMQAGDSCTVHAGTYREWINPPRGGSSDGARITYRAADGEQVFIKGSEQITGWTQEGGT